MKHLFILSLLAFMALKLSAEGFCEAYPNVCKELNRSTYKTEVIRLLEEEANFDEVFSTSRKVDGYGAFMMAYQYALYEVKAVEKLKIIKLNDQFIAMLKGDIEANTIQIEMLLKRIKEKKEKIKRMDGILKTIQNTKISSNI